MEGLSWNYTNHTWDHPLDTLTLKTSQLYSLAYGVVMIVVCVFGSVGNLLNLVVFSRTRFSSTTYTLFKFLALADLATMWLWIPEILRLGFHDSYFGRGMRFRSSAFYYAHISFPAINAAIIAGSLLILIISVERFVVICFPLKSSGFGIRRHLRLIVSSCFVLPLLLYLPSAWEYQVVDLPSGYHTKVWDAEFSDCPGFDTYRVVRVTMVRFIPITLVIVLNLVSAVKFRKIKIKHTQLLKPSSSSTTADNMQLLVRNTATSITRGGATSTTQEGSLEISDESVSNGGDREKVRCDKTRGVLQRVHEYFEDARWLKTSTSEVRIAACERSKMTMMVAIAIQYVLFMTPKAFYEILVNEERRHMWGFRVFTTIADLLDYLNAALNFYTYTLASRDFREQFTSFY